MKRLLSVLLVVLMMLFTMSPTVNASSLDIGEAITYMETKIAEFTASGGDDWNMHIVDYHELFDVDMEHYGYVFDLVKDGQEGYGIIVYDNGEYHFAEASCETASPYYEYDDRAYNYIYTSLLGYYVSSKIQTRSERAFLNLRGGDVLDYSDFVFKRYESLSYQQPTTRAVNADTYLPYYSSNFEKIKQHNNYSCQPTAFAMALKYMHNIGLIDIDDEYTSLSTLAETLYDVPPYDMWDADKGINTVEKAKTSIANFSRDHINYDLETISKSSMTSSSLQDYVDRCLPPIVVVKGGSVTWTGQHHSLTMVGYDNSTLLLVDPFPPNTPIRRVANNSTYVYLVFLLEFA